MTTPIGTTRPGVARGLPHPAGSTVDVLVCGSADRGDDGAPLAAADLLRGTLPLEVRVRRIGQLEVDHLLSVPADAGVVIVDAATGVASGSIHELSLRGALSPSAPIRPRSSHALEIPEVIGVADIIRGHPLVGSIVVIGGRQFGLGRPLSASVAKALPGLARTVRAATERVRATLNTSASGPVGGRA